MACSSANGLITLEQAIKALSSLPEDTEKARSTANRILLEVLRSNGLGEVADACHASIVAIELTRYDVSFRYAQPSFLNHP